METPDRIFHLQVKKRGNLQFQTWVTEEQKNFIQQYLHDTTPAHVVDDAAKITEVICRYFGETVALLQSRTRKSTVARCRQMCFYFFVKHLSYSTARAGRIFNRDHCTVLHAMKVVEAKYVKHLVELEMLLGLREASGLSVPVMATL